MSAGPMRAGLMPALFTRPSMRPNRCVHCVDEPGDRIPLTDVAREPEHLGTGRGRDLRGDLVAQLLLATAHHDRGAGSGQPLDHRPADALRRSGDDHHLAGEIEQLSGIAHRACIPPHDKSIESPAAAPRARAYNGVICRARAGPRHAKHGSVPADRLHRPVSAPPRSNNVVLWFEARLVTGGARGFVCRTDVTGPAPGCAAASARGRVHRGAVRRLLGVVKAQRAVADDHLAPLRHGRGAGGDAPRRVMPEGHGLTLDDIAIAAVPWVLRTELRVLLPGAARLLLQRSASSRP